MGSLEDLSIDVVKVSLTAFDKTALVTNIFLAPIVIGKVGYLNAVGGKSDSYTSLFKGIVLYFVLLYSFAPILNILIGFPDYFSAHLHFLEAESVRSSTDLIPNVVTYTLESVIAVLYYLAAGLSFAITVIMSAMAPLIFLLGGVLEIGLGVETFIGLLVMVSCWPIIFASCDTISKLLIPDGPRGLSGLSLELLIVFFKLAGPIAMAKAALSSHAGQAMVSTLSAAGSAGNLAANQAVSFGQGVSGKAHENPSRSLSDHAGHASRSLSYGAGRLLHRKKKPEAEDDKSATASEQKYSSSTRVRESRNLESQTLEKNPESSPNHRPMS